MNTVTVQLNDKQYDALHYLLEIARNEFTNQAQDDDLEDLLSVLTPPSPTSGRQAVAG